METLSDVPRIFIGSSAEGLQIAEYVQLALDKYSETTIWSQGIFGLSEGTLDSLIKACKQSDFAILVLTPDDMVKKRGDERPIARDNVVFELGLFIGSLGRDRTFIVHCQDDKIDIPSDLAGVTTATYRKRTDRNMQAAMNPVALKIRDAIRKVQENNISEKTVKIGTLTAPVTREEILRGGSNFYRYICDLLESLAGGRSGIDMEVRDQQSLLEWSHNLLGMLNDLFKSRQVDIYTAWLRPSNAGRLAVAQVVESSNLKKEFSHYEFHSGEGLAGKVWSTGTPVATSVLRKHEWWVYREGYDDESYICVPVGEANGSGGVLSVGSDLGFTVNDSDIDVLKIFASILALRVSSENNSLNQNKVRSIRDGS